MRYIESYVHHHRIGVLVELEIGGGVSVAPQEIQELALDIALQIAASNPVGLDAEQIENVIPIKFQLNKPSGDELPLLQQDCIKDTNISVKQHIAQIATKLKTPIRVIRFTRFSIDDS